MIKTSKTVSQLLFLAVLSICYLSTVCVAQDHSKKELKEYIEREVDILFIEDRITLPDVGGRIEAKLGRLDKNTVSIINEESYGADEFYLVIKCRKDKDAVKMVNNEDMPRQECVKRSDTVALEESIPYDTKIKHSLGFEGEFSKEGVEKAFRELISSYKEVNEDPKESEDTERSDGQKNVISVVKEGGVLRTNVTLNGVLKIDMVIDSGASEVSISPDVASTLVKSGTVEEEDWLESKTYVFADGSTAKSKRFKIDQIKIGNYAINDVAVSISNSVTSPLLLGQNVLSKLGEITIDYDNSRIIVEE